MRPTLSVSITIRCNYVIYTTRVMEHPNKRFVDFVVWSVISVITSNGNICLVLFCEYNHLLRLCTDKDTSSALKKVKTSSIQTCMHNFRTIWQVVLLLCFTFYILISSFLIYFFHVVAICSEEHTETKNQTKCIFMSNSSSPQCHCDSGPQCNRRDMCYGWNY